MADRAHEPAWDASVLSDPHKVQDKRQRVRRMFASIAPSYDANNRLHSLWRDQAWRRKAVRLAQLKPTDVVVDVACGTGDLSIALHQAGAQTVVGLDFTFEMLPRARAKSAPGKARRPPMYVAADATELPLSDGSADVVTIAFGLRNVQEPKRALAEFYRILRPEGRLVILEFSEPSNPILRAANQFYTGKVMPWTATLISRDRSGAYRYLPRSIGTFWNRSETALAIREAGFEDVSMHPMTFGVCVCYVARRQH
jgi:demethylmenaquinone methyltransferase/2-methoxy-6-polyprenyl-1,4-benzoquinol methylase